MSKKRDILQPGDRNFLDETAARLTTIAAFALAVSTYAYAELAGRIVAIIIGFTLLVAYLYIAWRKRALLQYLSWIFWGLFLGVVVGWVTSATITAYFCMIGFVIVSLALGIAHLVTARKQSS